MRYVVWIKSDVTIDAGRVPVDRSLEHISIDIETYFFPSLFHGQRGIRMAGQAVIIGLREGRREDSKQRGEAER